ncbi:MAG TPA: CBS domain-containing protein [Alphaproteobacteria bacterium]
MQRKIIPDVIDSQKLVVADDDATVREAVRLMAENGVGAVMIVEGNTLVGIFTERDLATRVVAPGLDPDRIRLAEVMTRDPNTIRPDETAHDALQKMQRYGCRHLPVVNVGTIVGMVSVRDLYKAVLCQLEDDLRELDAYVHGPGYGVAPPA